MPSSEGSPRVSRKNFTEARPSGKLFRTSSEVSRTSPTVFNLGFEALERSLGQFQLVNKNIVLHLLGFWHELI